MNRSNNNKNKNIGRLNKLSRLDKLSKINNNNNENISGSDTIDVICYFWQQKYQILNYCLGKYKTRYKKYYR